MSQAENLLDSLTVDDVTPYTAEPQSEGYIVIGRDRFITVPESLKRIAVQDDHNIETVTFECPRYWDENDLSEMQIFINYRRPDGVTGSYIAKNVKPQGDLIYFDWTIESHVTEFKGQLDFLVCTKETDDEGMEKRHWNTELNRDMYISEGLEVEGEIVSQNPAIITDLLTRMDEVEAMAVKEEALEQHVADATAAVARAEAAVATATDKAEDMGAIFEKFERTLPVNRFSGKTTAGYIKADGSGVLGDPMNSYTDYIPVTEGEVITLQATMFTPSTLEATGREIARITHVAAYDDRMTILPSLGSDTSSTSYTVPAGVSYIRISSDAFYLADPNNFDYEPDYLYGDIAIVASETVIPYEEYFNPTYGELKPENVISTTSQLANAIKGNTSGEIITIDDISPVEHNMSVKVRGKNLLPYTNDYTDGVHTVEGITFTRQSDGTVIANGTATATAYFLMQQGTGYVSQIPIEKDTYVLSTAPADGCRIAIGVRETEDAERTLLSASSTVPAVVEIATDTAHFDVILCVDSGITVENVVFKPQLERGTVATDYVPYVGMEDIKVITCGKNLTPYPYTENGVKRAGVTYTATEDGVIHANGTSTGSYMNVVSTDEKLLYLRKGVTYRFSCAPTGGEGSKYYAYVKDSSKTNHFDYGNGVTFTPSASGYGAITLVVSTDTVATDLMFKPMLVVGSGSVDFEAGGVVTKYSPDANGELVVRSVSPVAMIFADAEGVNIECEYNKDTGRAIEDAVAESITNTCANAVKGTKSGEAIVLTDASPIEHEMDVKVSGISDISTVKVKKYGKNFLNRNATAVFKGMLTFDGSRQTFTSVGGGGDLTTIIGKYKDFVGKTITVSYIFVDHQGSHNSFTTFIQADSTALTSAFNYNSATKLFKMTYTIPENDTAENLSIRQYIGYITSADGDYVTIDNFQVEIGDTVTDWEEYKEPVEYPVSADGIVEGVTSIYPNTTLMTDTAGAVIDCEYNRDANKVIADLENKINTLLATIAAG